MTPILKHLHKHFPAAWKQAEPNPNPDALSLWFEDTDACAYLEIGESRLYVRWPKGIGHGGQYGVGGQSHPCTREDLNASLPTIVADAALNEAIQGRPLPAVPEWAQAALRLKHSERLEGLAFRETVLRRALAEIVAKRAYLTEAYLLATEPKHVQTAYHSASSLTLGA